MIFQQIFSRSHNRNGKHTPDNEQDIAHGVCHRVAYRRDIAPDGILHGAERCGAGAGAGAAAECYGRVETEYLMAEPQSEKLPAVSYEPGYMAVYDISRKVHPTEARASHFQREETPSVPSL